MEQATRRISSLQKQLCASESIKSQALFGIFDPLLKQHDDDTLPLSEHKGYLFRAFQPSDAQQAIDCLVRSFLSFH
jgi:hypothetical protein